MYAGDRSRKENLIEHGFRLPSALDNRPLTFEEFMSRVGQRIYTSATPGDYELQVSKEDGQIVEQIIRPTGLVDPLVEVRPIVSDNSYAGQVRDFIQEVESVIKRGNRAIATTLTKSMAEDLSEFLKEEGFQAEYLHSEIDTLERIEILTKFRKGTFDILVGVNLLREGLDLPEVELIGILDADKEGFLRSDTSLIRIIGRAARNISGRVILYADEMTQSMKRAIDETTRRREKQLAYNREYAITPQTIKKKIRDITEELKSEHERAVAAQLRIEEERFKENPKKVIKEKRAAMNDAVKTLDFETAAILRDEIKVLEEKMR
jgi:excinuclease ABC subunit B